MGTDPASPDLPLVALQTADEKVDHIENLRAAIAAATMQRDHHVAKTAEQIRNEQLDAEAERLAKELAAIQADAEQREIPLTGIAAMRAAAALVPDSGQPVREVTMDDRHGRRSTGRHACRGCRRDTRRGACRRGRTRSGTRF